MNVTHNKATNTAHLLGQFKSVRERLSDSISTIRVEAAKLEQLTR